MKTSSYLYSLALAGFCFLLTSCFIPFPRILNTPVPPISGAVVDHKNGKPIENATVQFRGLKHTRTNTDELGRFTTRESKKIRFTMADINYVNQDLTLDIELDGYEASSLDLQRYGRVGVGWHYSIVSPTIKLTKKRAEQDVALDG
jgi:hypothetical protein